MKKQPLLRSHFAGRRARSVLALASVCLGLTASLSVARPVPQNLAGGLGALVESNQALKDLASKGATPAALYNGYATPQAASYAELAMQDPASDRFLVDIHPSGRVKAEELVPILQAKFASFTLTSLDKTYRGVGVVEGYISLDDVPALGNMKEVRSVQLGLKPELSRQRGTRSIQVGTTVPMLGTAFDQGVFDHQVDQINKFYNSRARLDLEGHRHKRRLHLR